MFQLPCSSQQIHCKDQSIPHCLFCFASHLLAWKTKPNKPLLISSNPRHKQNDENCSWLWVVQVISHHKTVVVTIVYIFMPAHVYRYTFFWICTNSHENAKVCFFLFLRGSQPDITALWNTLKISLCVRIRCVQNLSIQNVQCYYYLHIYVYFRSRMGHHSQVWYLIHVRTASFPSALTFQNSLLMKCRACLGIWSVECVYDS